jgi:hypothetical protein
LIERSVADGPGIAGPDVTLGAVPPVEEAADRFWLRPRGPLPAFWMLQRYAGRRVDARHTGGEPDVHR